MPSASEVAILLRLRGSRQVQSEFKSTARAMRQVNPVVSQMGRHFGLTNKAIVGVDKSMKRARSSIFHYAKGILAASAAFAAFRAIKDTITDTEDFAKATLRVTKATRLDTAEASKWVAIMKIRGIDATSFSRGLTIMSSKLRDASNGTKSSRQAFTQLGLSWRSVAALPLEERLFTVTDALNAQTDAGNRLALGQRIFGRGFQKLLPILSKGSKGIKEQLDLADKYGVTLHGHTVKSLKELIEAQHENELAMLGLQLTIGQKLIPLVTKGAQRITKFVYEMQNGVGTGGKLVEIAKALVDEFTPLFRLMSHHVKTILAVAGGFYFVYKTMVKARAAMIAFGIATETAGGPVFWIIGAIAALIYITILLDAKFHFLGKTVRWVRDNWKLLLLALPLIGPVAFLIVAAIKPVVSVFKHAYHWASKLAGVIGKIKAPFGWAGKAGGFLKHAGGGLGGLVNHANGGNVSGPRNVRVGEFGPEIVSLPGGAHVTRASASGGGEMVTVPVNLYLDGKVLATSTARVVADRKARR